MYKINKKSITFLYDDNNDQNNFLLGEYNNNQLFESSNSLY